MTDASPPTTSVSEPAWKQAPQDDPQRILYEAEPEVWESRPDYVFAHAHWRRWYRDRVRCRARGGDGYRCHHGVREPHRDVCRDCRAAGRQGEDWTGSTPAQRPTQVFLVDDSGGTGKGGVIGGFELPAPALRRAPSLSTPEYLGANEKAYDTFTAAARKALEADAAAYARLPGMDRAGTEPHPLATLRPEDVEEARRLTPGTGETEAAPASRGTPLSRASAKTIPFPVQRIGEPAMRRASSLDIEALEAQLAGPVTPEESKRAHAAVLDRERAARDAFRASMAGPGVPGQSFELDGVRIETTLHGPGVSFTKTLREAPERRVEITIVPLSDAKPRRRGSSLDDLGPRQLREDEKLPGTCQLSNKGCPRYYTLPRVRPPGDDLPERREPKGGRTCCPEGRCWYDEQLDRRSRLLPALDYKAWLGIIRGEIVE